MRLFSLTDSRRVARLALDHDCYGCLTVLPRASSNSFDVMMTVLRDPGSLRAGAAAGFSGTATAGWATASRPTSARPSD